MKSTKFLLISAVSSACLCLPAQANVLFNFFPNKTTNPAIGTQQFTSTTPLVAGNTSAFSLSNVIASGVTPPAAATDLPRFVGGASFSAAAVSPENIPSLRTVSNLQMWRWFTQTAPAADQSWEFRSVLMVQQSDWNALTSGTVGFNSTSSMTLDLDDNGGMTTNSAFVVLNNGQYYVSQLTQGKSLTTLSFDAAAEWAAFDPTNFNTVDFSTLSFSAQTASFFSDIEAVGFYWQANATDKTDPKFSLFQFEVDAVAVPEPSTYALLLGATGLLTVLLARRRNRR